MKTPAAITFALLLLPGCLPPAGDLFAHGEEFACARTLDPWPTAERPVAVRVGLAIPNPQGLARVSVSVAAKPGHTRLPASLPAFAVGAEWPGGSVEVLGMARDTSRTVEEYEAPHELEVDLWGAEIPERPIVALSYSERGDGAVSGGKLLGWRCATE